MRSLVFLLGLLCSANAAAVEKYVLVEWPPMELRPAEEEKVLAAIRAGIRAEGCEVAIGWAGAGATCTTSVCWKGVAVAAKATDVLVVTGEYKDFGWRLALEHRSGATGARIGGEKENCDTCPFPSMVEHARVAAQRTAESGQVEAPAEPIPTPTVSAAPRATNQRASGATEERVGIPPAAVVQGSKMNGTEGSPTWPIWLMAGGGAAVLGGGALLVMNGRDWGCSDTRGDCTRRFKTITPGLIVGGVGALGLGLGIWQYFSSGNDGARVALWLGPNSVALAGGF